MESQLIGQKIFSRSNKRMPALIFPETSLRLSFRVFCSSPVMTHLPNHALRVKIRFARKIVTLFYRRSGRAIGLTIVISTFPFDFLAFTVPRT